MSAIWKLFVQSFSNLQRLLLTLIGICIKMLPLVTYTKNIVPTCGPTFEPTYCPAVGQHVY